MRDWAARQRLGQDAARAGDPRRRRRGHARAYVEAYERIAGEPFDAWLERSGAREGARADPAQGRASSTRRARPSSARCRRSASRASRNVHVGRLIELDVEDPDAAAEPMCEKLLANPLIEDYEVVSTAADAQ